MTSKPQKKKYVDGLDKQTYDRYIQKTQSIDVDPYEVSNNRFTTDHKCLPAITYIDILNYLVNTTSAYTFEELRAYKSLEAYNQFINGWVTGVKSLTTNNKVLVMGRVRHSQRMNDTPLRPWIIASPAGLVESGHCDCMAGLGEACTHVGALLFYSMEAYRISSERTPTQEKAYWVLPSSLDKVPYAEVQNIDFTTAETKKKYRDSAHRGENITKRNTLKLPDVPEPTSDEISGLMQALFVTRSKASILTVTSKFQEHFIPEVMKDGYLPQSLLSLREDEYLQMEKEELREKCVEIFNSLKVTDEQCQNVQTVTKEQSKSKEWHTLRIGRITASQMKSACTSSTETPAMSTLNSICGNTSFSNKATQWGCDHEAVALSTYSQKISESHVNVAVKKCGLYLTPKHPHIGASPDAVITCDCCGNGVVEIKCPYCVKDKDLKDAGSQLNFLHEGKLKSNHKYSYQVQTQMLVTEMDYCDFVVWTERGCSMERIKPNKAIQMEIIDKSRKYFVSVVLPELTGKIFTRERIHNMEVIKDNRSASFCSRDNVHMDSSQELICVCRKPYNEAKPEDDVIGCDNENCKYVWLHFKCVNIKSVPRGAYYCPECKPPRKKRKKDP